MTGHRFRFPLTIGNRQAIMLMTNRNDKSGELLSQERRRRWSPEQKLAMDREGLEPGQSDSMVAPPNGCVAIPRTRRSKKYVITNY